MALDRAWILRHLPHQGTMCLLDRVEGWDATAIACTTARHRDPENPLRSRGRLAGVCATVVLDAEARRSGPWAQRADSAQEVP